MRKGELFSWLYCKWSRIICVTLTLTGRSCIRDINSCCPWHEGLHRDSSAGVEAASASRGSFQMSACDASLPPLERCHLADISPPSRFISTIINQPSNNAPAVTRRTRALPGLLCHATPCQWKPRQIQRPRVTLSRLHRRATRHSYSLATFTLFLCSPLSFTLIFSSLLNRACWETDNVIQLR